MFHIPGFRQVPRTGVIYVMTRAKECGYSKTDTSWATLGQGSPEIGEIPGAPPRIETIEIDRCTRAYTSIPGEQQLREKVAEFYNHFFRKGKRSQYTAGNVSIAGGGRPALARIAAALGNINMGHFIPDYTAYEELLSIFKAFSPIPILYENSHFTISPSRLKQEILDRGLEAILLSNPCNPTGQVIYGEELFKWVRLSKEVNCSFIFDEFYSRYVYMEEECKMFSAAEYIENVEEDPVIIVDGITKNWRYPGWRLSWTLGPQEVIENIGSAGSFLDGGASHPIQHAVMDLLEPNFALAEAQAIQKHFRKKRDYTLERLKNIGFAIPAIPQGAFYVWCDLSSFPEPLQDGMNFFEEGLKEKVITVPGIFFDVNPGKRRSNAHYEKFVRISFGAEMNVLEKGIDALERMIRKFQ